MIYLAVTSVVVEPGQGSRQSAFGLSAVILVRGMAQPTNLISDVIRGFQQGAFWWNNPAWTFVFNRSRKVQKTGVV